MFQVATDRRTLGLVTVKYRIIRTLSIGNSLLSWLLPGTRVEYSLYIIKI